MAGPKLRDRDQDTAPAEVGALVEALRGERGLILILTGAGVSLASGIPTFRGQDPDAVWTRDVTELATLSYFQRDPVGSWTWYQQRFLTTLAAKPNPAHLALAALERWQVARGGDFLLIAQNIDTLHEQAGSERLVKVHGSADRLRCRREGCRWGAPSGSLRRDALDLSAFERAPTFQTLPRCPECKNLLRPHVLWFDELYASHADYGWDRVGDATSRMRLVLCIGTSFSVGVTDVVVSAARADRLPLFSIDPHGPPGPSLAGVSYLPFKAEELLPAVCRALTLSEPPVG
jgi:NAD-dependent deacetylase